VGGRRARYAEKVGGAGETVLLDDAGKQLKGVQPVHIVDYL
jgi:hypothetical protein